MLGELLVVADDDDGKSRLRRYNVTLADYSSYQEKETHRVCIHAAADELIEPVGVPESEIAQPWLEIRLTFQSAEESKMELGKVFRTPAYNDETDEWLTHFYHFSHGGLEDAEVEVLGVDGESVTLGVRGVSEESDPISMRARFVNNQLRRPS